MTDADTLTSRQKRAIGAMLTASSLAEAAQMTGISERTLIRWKEKPAFKAALTFQESEALTAVTRRLLGLADEAVATISGVLTDSVIPASTRLRAAEIVLANLLKLRELVDLENRVAQLEKAYAAKK